jgi:hypothetical protein
MRAAEFLCSRTGINIFVLRHPNFEAWFVTGFVQQRCPLHDLLQVFATNKLKSQGF